MQRVITFIVARDENNQDILMNIEIDKELKIKKLNIAGYVLNQTEIDAMSDKIKINEELFNTLKDNEPLDITSQFVNMTKEQIIESLGGVK